MSHSRSRKRRRYWHKREQKILNSPIKELSMEDKSPTMPYMLLRNFRVHQTVPTSQGQTSYCEYFAAGEVLCPRCSSNEVVFYDHYKRRAMFLLRGYEKRYFVIKAKRYRCPHCGRVFSRADRGIKGMATQQHRPQKTHGCEVSARSLQ